MNAALVIALAAAPAMVKASPAGAVTPDEAPPAATQTRRLDINEYRVHGASQLTQAELEAALLPFAGPARALEDVEAARAALEKAFSDRGFQTVTVAIPPQTVRDGVVTLEATEGRVGRLRVRGAHWFSPLDIKRQACSVAEGTVPNFNAIVHDIVLLNQLPDRRVTPALRPGLAPGTVDVDLDVQDTLPLHGSLDFNNRHSAGTTNLRVNGNLHYDNLWQRGHSFSFSFQSAPRRVDDGVVLSLSYLARVADLPWLTLSLNGLIQDSDVSTLGSVAVKGKGRVLGARAGFTLPGPSSFFHTVSAGLDYKRFDEALNVGPQPDGTPSPPLETPITYWPVTAQYAATWPGETSQTQLTATVVLNLRGLSSGADEFDAKRYKASGSFIYYRGELARTQDVRQGFQLFGRLQGQYASDPILSSEQFTAGGAESVRGYLEAEAAGDYGALGTVEVRSPSLTRWFGRPFLTDWRLLAFFEGGRLGLRDALPEQKDFFLLWGTGAGTRLRLYDHVFGSADVGVPLTSAGTTQRYHPKFHLRLSGEF